MFMQRMTRGEKIFAIVNYFILTLLSAVIIFPILSVVINSFRDAKDIMINAYTLLPERVNLEAYKFLLVDSRKIADGFTASLFITGVGTLLCLMFTGSMAYPLSKKYLPGKNAITMMVFITMFFSGGLVPGYLLVTFLGMKDTWWALIIPGMISPWYMILMRNFYYQVPEAIEESAKIEGANDILIFLRMYIPLSLPAIMTIGLFYAVGFWNSWFSASIYLNTLSKYPLQLVLKIIMSSANITALMEKGVDLSNIAVTEENVKSAAIVLTTLPIILVYPFVQKYLVKGVYVGSIKG